MERRCKPVVCTGCGATYTPRGNRSKQCDACRSVICAQCGASFVNPHTSHTTRYCSSACYLAARWGQHQKVEYPTVCKGCGGPIAKPASGKTYCTSSCRLRTMWADPENKARIVTAIKASPSVRSDARRRQLDTARRNRKFGPETREKIRRARLRQTFPTKMTSIERALHDGFKRRRLRFEMHRTMFDRFQPDFVFADALLIVQADGDYWHSRPASVKRDAEFDALAAADGWAVMRFPESTIKRDAATCVRAVARYVRDATRHLQAPSAGS